MRHTNNSKYRYYIIGSLELISPLILGSGENDIADIQCIRDWDDNLFIPGTAFAGNIRHHLAETLKDKALLDKFFGSHKENSGHSLFSFFDSHFSSYSTEVRDGIRLDNLTKTVRDKSKYDYEIINKGAIADFRMEVVIREQHTEEDKQKIEAIIAQIVTLLKTGEFRIGAKTSRGFGRVKLTEPKFLSLELPDDIELWKKFSWDNVCSDFDLVCEDTLFLKDNSYSLQAEFTIPESLIIRSYSSDPDGIDASTLTSAGQPVIPGTSWNGALRHALENAGRELGRYDEMSELIKKLFGDVDDSKGSRNSAIPSKIMIEESAVVGGKLLPYVRNKIDRFTGGVVNSALFDEMPVYGGKVMFECKIRQPEDFEIGMLLLSLKELENGIQTVGGGANIGRGRLNLQGSTVNSDDEKKYLDALGRKLAAKEVD